METTLEIVAYNSRMSSVSVSIIIPVYNVAPYIEDCICSVMRQSYTGPMECLVVDDCCTDESMEIVVRLISDYVGHILFKIIHHASHRGVSAARNTGIEAASYDYIFFLDSDDWITVDCVKKQASSITNSSVEVVQGNTKTYPETQPDANTKVFSSLHVFSNRDVRYVCYHGNQMPYVWNKLISRAFINKFALRFVEGLLWEDVVWNFYLQKYVQNVCFVSDITYYHRTRPGSIVTGTEKQQRLDNFIAVYTIILLNLTSRHEREELEHYIVNFPSRYACNPTVFRKVYKVYWEKSIRYKSYYCCRRLAYAMYLRLKHSLWVLLKESLLG